MNDSVKHVGIINRKGVEIMLESVTVLANIEYSSERHTIALEQERAGYYATIVLDERQCRWAIENEDREIPDDDEAIVRGLRNGGLMTGDTARELLGLARRYEVQDLRWLLALARVLEKEREK